MAQPYATNSELMAAFESGDDRTGADFRAMRERIGWSQNDVERALGCTPTTVKKWESPITGWSVLPYGWAWIDKMYAQYFEEVDALTDLAISRIKSHGIKKGETVRLSYYRNIDKQSYDKRKRNAGRTRHQEPPSAANAVSRAVGDYLEDEGYKVRYVWAEDGGWII